MMFPKKSMSLALPVLFLVPCVLAEEGMWRFDQLPLEMIAETYGVELDPDALARLERSAVRLLSGGGGGTGSFASANGLILTNHHVALDCIRTSSLAEQEEAENLIDKGFTAGEPQEELACTRFVAQIERESRDVTRELDAVQTDVMSVAEIQQARQRKRSELERNCQEDKGANYSCSVEEFNSGAQALLIVYEEYRDIRLVYAPEKQLGFYGGDEMNFRFPRFVSDISILRAYEGEDGSRGELDASHVPARPADYLKVSLDGIQEGELALVAGFPGNTNRYRMSFSADYNLKKGIPNQLAEIDRELELLRRYAAESEPYELALQSRIFGLANTRKYLADVLGALEASDIGADRKHREELFMDFLEQHPEAMKAFGDVLTLQGNVYRDDVETFIDLDSALSWLSRSQTFSFAFGLYEFALEREKTSDADREPQFQQRNWPRVRQGLLDDDPIIEGLEEDFLAIGFEKALALPEALRIEAVTALQRQLKAPADARALARNVLSGSSIGDAAIRETLITEGPAAFEQSSDPAVRFARAMLPDFRAQRTRIRTLNQKLFLNRSKFARGMVSWQGEALYTDANFTLRLSFGRPAGYVDRRGASVPFQTTLAGLFELAAERDGEESFMLPARLTSWRAGMTAEAFAERYADLPVNFVTTNDLTGGNSGSALLNSSFEIVGLIFDGNEDATASDWTYSETAGRAISTDIRFALTIAREIHDAGWIVDELLHPARVLEPAGPGED